MCVGVCEREGERLYGNRKAPLDRSLFNTCITTSHSVCARLRECVCVRTGDDEDGEWRDAAIEMRCSISRTDALPYGWLPHSG